MVIGRDLRADVRVAHPLISRTHLIVRFDQGRWIAIDGSLNGLYVNNRRVPVVDIQDGLRVNIGNPDGPALTFEVGRHQGSAGRPPLTTSIPVLHPHGDAGGAPTHGQPQQPPPAPFRHPAQPPGGPQRSHPSGPLPGYPRSLQPRHPTGAHHAGQQRAAAGAADLPGATGAGARRARGRAEARRDRPPRRRPHQHRDVDDADAAPRQIGRRVGPGAIKISA